MVSSWYKLLRKRRNCLRNHPVACFCCYDAVPGDEGCVCGFGDIVCVWFWEKWSYVGRELQSVECTGLHTSNFKKTKNFNPEEPRPSYHKRKDLPIGQNDDAVPVFIISISFKRTLFRLHVMNWSVSDPLGCPKCRDNWFL